MNSDNISIGDMAKKRLLIFAEDPGAVMYLAHLPDMLRAEGFDIHVMTAGNAIELWSRKGLSSNKLPHDASCTSMLDAYKPSIVIVGTSENLDSFSFELTETARTRGITSVGIVDSAANAAERFRGRGISPLSYAPDWLIVPDQTTAHEFISLGFLNEHIWVCGHPQYDEVVALRIKWSEQDRREMRKKWFPAAEQERPILMFISEISTGLNPRQFRRSSAYTLQGRPENDGRTEIVLDELLMAVKKLPEKPYLVLRLHPKQELNDLCQHQHLFDQISLTEPALEMVNAADVIVGMTSMLLIESSLLGRPTLSVVPRAEEHAWLGFMALTIPCAWTRIDLCDRLLQLISGEYIQRESLICHDSREKILQFFREHFM